METPSGPHAPTPWMNRGPGLILIGVLACLVVIAGFFALVASRYSQQQSQPPRLTGIPSSVSSSLADLMALQPLPSVRASNFSLVDQYGHRQSMTDYRGKVAVMEFMDTHCTDICPIVSQEFVDAYHDLGTDRTRVVFLAVNVNPYHAGVADVAAFSNEHRLDTIATWHFVTGSTSALKAVWRNYGIEVVPRGPKGDVVHSSEVLFIGPSGQEKFLANPIVNHTSAGTAFLPEGQITQWGQGIELTAKSLIK